MLASNKFVSVTTSKGSRAAELTAILYVSSYNKTIIAILATKYMHARKRYICQHQARPQHVSHPMVEIIRLRSRMVRSVYSPHGPIHTDHIRITLHEPCRPDRDLLTCPKFIEPQVYGPAVLPRGPFYMAPRRSCPRCYRRRYSRRDVQMIRVTVSGYKFGLGPGRDDCGVTCPCSVM